MDADLGYRWVIIARRFTSAKGIKIMSDEGDELEELQLSSGEYHLLYMLVTALVTHRMGTIIAIDEPELSLHISWQRKLIHALNTKF